MQFYNPFRGLHLICTPAKNKNERKVYKMILSLSCFVTLSYSLSHSISCAGFHKFAMKCKRGVYLLGVATSQGPHARKKVCFGHRPALLAIEEVPDLHPLSLLAHLGVSFWLCWVVGEVAGRISSSTERGKNKEGIGASRYIWFSILEKNVFFLLETVQFLFAATTPPHPPFPVHRPHFFTVVSLRSFLFSSF